MDTKQEMLRFLFSYESTTVQNAQIHKTTRDLFMVVWHIKERNNYQKRQSGMEKVKALQKPVALLCRKM